MQQPSADHEPREGDILLCPECPRRFEVSIEDPDATLSEIHSHLLSNGVSRSQALVLLARVELVRAGGAQ